MARLKLTPDQAKTILALVIPLAESLAARTETKFDDRLVAALKAAADNPVILAIVLSLLAGDPATPTNFAADPKLSGMESGYVEILEQNAGAVQALFALV